ncbi:MAG TPA: DUF1802 family protein [Nitrosopumilaceae archaeon]|nr:DUF1802 family protein [Nitrosopumilaceae archaeon]
MDALKEWATVVQALENGDQTVILRKGGILETASGFKIESKKFILFPTFEHQEIKNLKPQFHHYLDIVNQNLANGEYNKITSYAEVMFEADIDSQKKIDELSKFHIWSESYIKERMNWMPEKPIKAVFLKVYKVPEIKIPIKSEYHGCKSWININEEINEGKPVLSDTEINLRFQKFKEIVK